MNSKFWKRLTGAFLACAMALPTVSGGMFTEKAEPVSAAGTNFHFDFGGGGTASGYTGVSATTGYNKSTGYGFANTGNVKNVSASGGGALSDAVQFTNTSWSNTFNVDLPNGLYRVSVTLGNTNRTSVVMEGMMQIVNMTGNNATDSILIPITDGQLNIMATDGKAGYAHTMSALDIEWVSGETTLPPTIWMCGDSTVCNYYPKATSGQAGWGQVLDQYVDPSWQVRNMAASGQYAKGFVDAGQFAPILKYGKQGDIYIISIGINDTNYSNATEYTEVVTSMVQQAKAKGMQVILVKQQGRASDVNRNPLLTGRWFGGQLDAIGAAEGVQVIDLFTLWQNHTTSIGYDATLGLYCSGDDLHPNRKGAMKLAELASSQIDWSNTGSVAGGAEIEENTPFLLRNGNSGLYLSVDGAAEQGTNVAQTGITGLAEGRNLWKAEAAEDGYYRLYSCANDSTLLDVEGAKNENGTNIALWDNSGSDAQLFKFIPQADGSYVIATKASDDKRCADVIDADKSSGANIRQWERNGHACQTWFLEKVVEPAGEFTPGDVNEDGVINAFDVAIMKKMLSDDNLTRRQKRPADADADFGVTASDCKMVSDFVLNRGSIEPSATGNRVYYAVDQAYYSGVEEDYNLGYVSDAYLNLDNKIGSFAEWTVTVPKDGNFLCTFLIANGSASNRTMKIEVNNEKDYWMQDFLTTGAWTTWQERGIVLPLKAGKNIIRTTSATAEGGPNIDYLRLEWTDEPIAGIYNPTTTPETPGASGKTIYIAGDSTVQTYNASYAPQQGWGAFLGNYLNDVNVSNHAIAGRSSKSFYDNGRLDTILNEIKPGDYLFVQFGINDAAYNKAERYAPTCGSVPGTDGSFEFYMAKYIEGAKAKGATPVLVTTVIGLKSYDNNSRKFVGSYTNYCDAMKKCAAYYKIPCIDLNTLMVNHYNSIGYDKAYTYHMISTGNGSTDQTHFTETGANAVAGLVANGIKGLNVDISSNVK